MLCFTALLIGQTAFCDPFCFQKTAEQYQISAHLLKAISLTESNFDPNAIHHNRNGSIDYGHMQINSWWQDLLGDDFLYLNDPCYCTQVGAWILKNCIKENGSCWDAVVCYHMGKSYSRLTESQKIEAERYLGVVQRNLVRIEAGIHE